MARASNLKVWLALFVAAASAAIVVAIGVALGASTAVAATPTRATIEATDAVTLADGTSGEAFAVCPGTKRALGGGVVQSGPAHIHLAVLASGPLDSSGLASKTNDGDVAKQWYAAVRNVSGEQRTFKVFAICSGNSNATIEATPFTVEENGPNDAGKTAEEYAVCPGTKRALGGGLVQSGTPEGISLLASGPLDSSGFTSETKDGDRAKQWYAAVGNFGGQQRDLKVFAICE